MVLRVIKGLTVGNHLPYFGSGRQTYRSYGAAPFFAFLGAIDRQLKTVRYHHHEVAVLLQYALFCLLLVVKAAEDLLPGEEVRIHLMHRRTDLIDFDILLVGRPYG